MRNVVHSLNQQEQALFDDIAALFDKHASLNGEFSISRVHSHFPLSENEILLETSDVEKRVSTVRPIYKSQIPSDTIISQWSVEKVNGVTRIEPTLVCCVDNPAD